MLYFYCSLAKMSEKLTESQIELLADYYTKWYEVPDTWTDVKDVLTRYGQNRKYPLFKVICHHAGIIDKNNEKNVHAI